MTDIVVAQLDRLVLGAVSESGEIFCIDATAEGATRGSMDRTALDAGTAACSPGGW